MKKLNHRREVRLILQPGNGYQFIDGGDTGYGMLAPIEKLP